MDWRSVTTESKNAHPSHAFLFLAPSPRLGEDRVISFLQHASTSGCAVRQPSPTPHLCPPQRPQVEFLMVTRQSWHGASHQELHTGGELLPPATLSSYTESISAVPPPLCQHFDTSQQQPDAGPSEDLPQCFLTVLNQHPVTQRGVPTLNLQRTAQIITAFGKRLALHNNHTARAGQCLRTAPRQRWEGSRHWGTQSRGPMHTCCQATPSRGTTTTRSLWAPTHRHTAVLPRAGGEHAAKWPLVSPSNSQTSREGWDALRCSHHGDISLSLRKTILKVGKQISLMNYLHGLMKHNSVSLETEQGHGKLTVLE